MFFILSPYCSSYPYPRELVRNGEIKRSMQLFTRALPCFTELHAMFYDNKVKVIPENIYQLLTPVAMAH